MEYEALITAISTVGFPIVLSIGLLWFLIDEKKTHKEEMLQLKDVISKNNEILAGLSQLINDKLN